MLTDNNSSLSKVSSKKMLKTNPIVDTIGSVKYKYMLFKAKDDGIYCNATCLFNVINKNNEVLFHIIDESIAKALYDALTNKEIDFATMPDEFKGIRFMVVKKQKKVVFISCDKATSLVQLDNLSQGKDKQALENVYNLALWFTNNFSCLSSETKFLEINIPEVFEAFLVEQQPFLYSFFSSIRLTANPYLFTSGMLENIVKILISNYTYLSFSKTRHRLQEDDEIFYYLLNRGIYMGKLDDSKLGNLPNKLQYNIFRYLLNPTCFNGSEEDFFKGTGFNNGNHFDANSNLIFDNKLFEDSIEKEIETEEFVIYKDTGTSTPKQCRYMKIKQLSKFANIENLLCVLQDSDMAINNYILHSCLSDEIFLCSYEDELCSYITLAEYIESVAKKPRKIADLILLVNNVFSSKAYITQNLFIKEGYHILDVLCVDEHESRLVFKDISKLCFDKKQEHVKFEYPLCIMQIVEKFVNLQGISEQDIYKYEFMKLFPELFAHEIINYISTKEYNAKGILRKLKGTLNATEMDKVEFLENVLNEGNIENLTLLPQYLSEDLVSKINIARPKSNLEAQYISLEDRISYVTKRKDLHLSSNIIKQITEGSEKDELLIPAKLVISKDVYDEKGYLVIGVIWNKAKLYTLEEFIRCGLISTQNVYQIVIRKIMQMYYSGYRVNKLKGGLGALLIDGALRIVIDCNSYNKARDILSETGNTSDYYYEIVYKIKDEFSEYLENFTVIDYQNLMDACDEDLLDSFYRIRFCNEHEQLYLSQDLCPKCEELYVVGETDYEEEIYRNGGLGFYSLCDDLYGSVWDFGSKTLLSVQNRVKLGIERGFYKKFPELIPEKLVVNQEGDNRIVVGIMCSDYDFSNVIELKSFKHMQRLKVILVLYKKILPYIEDYSFIASKRSVFNTMFMDKECKGEIIVPNLPLLEVEVSLSEDMALKEKKKQKTLKLFSEFLQDYITSDTSLKAEINRKDTLILKVIERINNCNFDEKYIREYISSKDHFCKTHGVYFSSNDKLCPECVSEGIPEDKATILDIDYFSALESQKAEHEGGEAYLYSTDNDMIEKIFKDDVNIGFKSKVIAKALQKKKLFDEFNRKHTDIQFISIDDVLYSFDNKVLKLEGYRQKNIEGAYKISSLKDKSFVDSLGYEQKDIVEILIKVSKAIEYLHSIGGFIGDLNGGNILIKDKVVYIIDMDGMSFDDVKNCVYTHLYIYPPSAEAKNITALDDWYSFAVQAFYYLTYSHPFRGVCARKDIPTNEIERMKCGYSVLGNHGIKVPSISIGWDSMPSYMTKFFLETFEGKKRESMRKTLEDYLGFLCGSNKVEYKEKRLNKVMAFNQLERLHEAEYEISENIYIDTHGVVWWKEKSIARFHDCIDSLLHTTVCGDSIIICSSDECVVLNDVTGTCYRFNKNYYNMNLKTLYAYENKVYYSKFDDPTVYVDEVDDQTDEIRTYQLRRATKNVVKNLSIYQQDKFVIIEENEAENTYDIYCNMLKMYSVPMDGFEEVCNTNILYDCVSGSWIVLFTNKEVTKIVKINNLGVCSESKCNKHVSNSSVYYRNMLYFVGDKVIYMYNVNTGVLKQMPCNVASVKSVIFRKNNKFVIVDKSTYVYEKS